MFNKIKRDNSGQPQSEKPADVRRKTFLLGLGAQKAGTTWVHSLLNSHPECQTARIKEYHIFDVAQNPAMFGSAQATYLARAATLLTQKAKLPNRKTENLDTQLEAVLTRVITRLNPERHYLNIFREQLAENPSTRLVADITPSYSGLQADDFKRIRAIFDDSEFDLRVVFIMRDPISRLHSALKMVERKQRENNRKDVTPAASQFAGAYRKPEHQVRTRYENTLRAIDEAFAPDQVHLAFYETLFNEASVRKLSDFLGITYRTPNFDKKINESPTSEPLSDKDRNNARAFYADTYRYCFERFGEDFIRSIWKNA